MSPALEMPLNRREAVASLIAMLAFVLGTADSDAAGAAPDVREPTEPAPQPLPSSSVDWGAQLRFFSNDEHLPLRILEDVQASMVYDGHTLRMNLFLWPDPAWIDHVEQPTVPLGSFVFEGNPAPLLDRFSADGDAEWLKFETRRARRPSAPCPSCNGHVPEWFTCTTCDRTGWIFVTPAADQQRIEEELAERQALIEAAVRAAGR